MNQDKIGKYISEKRKNKKITQKELADNLNISEKTISKWECGKGLPEVSLMQPLCKELNITVNELLNGQDEQNNDDNQGYINYIKYNNQKNKNKIMIYSLIFLMLLLILTLGMYFINNYGKTTVYKLYGNSENFTYLDGLLIKSSDKIVLVPGKIISNNEESIKTENVNYISLKSSNQLIIAGSFNGISIEDNGYNEIFTKEKINNLNNWYLEITYNVNGQEKTETLKVQNELIINSDKFLSKITSSIGNNFQKSINNNIENTTEEVNKLERKLKKDKFTTTKTSLYEKEVEGYTIRVNTKTNYVRIYKSDVAYGDDSIDIKYNCEGCQDNIIKLELSSEGESYYILYNIDEESLTCSNNKCPSSAWQICKDFYQYVTELLTIE